MSTPIQSLIAGSLIKDAEVKVSGSGKGYVALTIRTEGESPLFVRASVWGDDAETVRTLKRGDGVALVGKLTIGIWQSAEGPAPSLSLMASRAISPAAKKPNKPRAAPRPAPRQGTQRELAALFHPRTVANSDGLADDLPWESQA